MEEVRRLLEEIGGVNLLTEIMKISNISKLSFTQGNLGFVISTDISQEVNKDEQ